MSKPLIYERWPPLHADWIQLYSINSPNGIKVAVALEEMKLDYDPHLVNIREGDQHTAEFRSVSPNAKIPALISAHHQLSGIAHIGAREGPREN